MLGFSCLLGKTKYVMVGTVVFEKNVFRLWVLCINKWFIKLFIIVISTKVFDYVKANWLDCRIPGPLFCISLNNKLKCLLCYASFLKCSNTCK